MKFNESKFFFIILFLTISSVFLRKIKKKKVSAKETKFCWKDTYGRGVGTVPRKCKADQDQVGLLCYSKCPNNYTRFNTDCHSKCPHGWMDQGLFCRLAEYGRGFGYPWHIGDPLDTTGMFERCETDWGKGKCEKADWEWIVYPKCKPGYTRIGCCICRPEEVPKCEEHGLNKGIDLSCAKKIIIGAPETGTCEQEEDKNVGLCYKKCDNGFRGVGPVCWAPPPKDWVDCGMGAAIDSKTCGSIISQQVLSVGSLALNIATLGTSAAVTTLISSAQTGLEKLADATSEDSIDKIDKILDAFGDKEKEKEREEKLFEDLKKQCFKIQLIKKVNKLADQYNITRKEYGRYMTNGQKIENGIIEMVEKANKLRENDQVTTVEDVLRKGAEVASFFDPTGASQVVKAYLYPKCSSLFGK